MVPLERGWPVSSTHRPEYVLMESSRTAELLSAVTGNQDLRHRIRGTGATPAMRSIPVNDGFRISYSARFPGRPADLFGMGPAYDATYAIAYGIAALRGGEISGRSIARRGDDIELQGSKVLSAFRALTQGSPVSIIGASAPLKWREQGAIAGGTIELWCISDTLGKPNYASSGLTLDLATGEFFGQYTQCSP
jgi:hypothetical protein